MADYTLAELKSALAAAGFQGEALDTMAAIALAENDAMELNRVNTIGNSPPSRDRGPFQINDYWHAEIPDSCAFDLACSAQAVYKISDGGTSFGAWSTYNSGAYLDSLAKVRGAAGAVADLVNLGPIPTPGDIPNLIVKALTSLLEPVRKGLLGAVFVAGGLGLVVAGLWRGVAPIRGAYRSRVEDKAAELGPLAAMA